MPSGLKRYQASGHNHFVTFSCYCRLPYLTDDTARQTFLDVLETVRQRHRFLLFGYVLMPEHVHLLLSEPKDYPLSATLNVVKTHTSRRLKADRKQFWQKRYYDFNVFTQSKFTEKLRYIHRNPVTRGLVVSPELWAWSSFRHWQTGEAGAVEVESHWTWNRRGGSSEPFNS